MRRLGAEEAKRRENLRQAESQAQAEGKGVWSEDPENVRLCSFVLYHFGEDDHADTGPF